MNRPAAPFDVFLSYNTRDHAAVETLARALRDAGLHVFLDRWYLTPGTDWVGALEATLQSCRAVAICLGAEMGSWQHREQFVALDHQGRAQRSGKLLPVIPVLLPGGEAPLGFLAQNTWVDLQRGVDDPQALAVLVKAIRGEPPGPDTIPGPNLVQVCPYRGLLHFREEDAALFFGRDAIVNALVEVVQQKSLVALVGASGSGKSSIVRAGLIPHLRKSKAPVWEFLTIVPGDRPLHALASAFMPLLEPEMSEVARLGEMNGLAESFRTHRIKLRDVVDSLLTKQPGTSHVLLFVDQWEELFTHTADESARELFMAEILDATQTARLSVVLTLRGDYFGRAVSAYRSMSDRLQGAQVNVGSMNRDELRAAIEAPAQLLGLQFQTGLVGAILEDWRDAPGNLPLLEFVLLQLWEQRRGQLMHWAAYEEMGKLSGAIAQRADAVYQQLGPSEQQLLRHLMTHLVNIGDEGADTRRRANLADFDDSARRLIDKLSDERLLITSKSANGRETVEVAHEALIRNWALLRSWIDADREFFAWHKGLTAAAEEYRTQPNAPLLRGKRLAQARLWQKQKGDSLSRAENDFIRRSLRAKRSPFIALASLIMLVILWYVAAAMPTQHKAWQLGDRGMFDTPDYALRFVEIDDGGRYWDPRQPLDAIATVRRKLAERNTLVVTYVHGWHESAAPCNRGLEGFRILLQRLKADAASELNVVGVYIGWRGRSAPGALDYFTFWARKAAAERIGRRGLKDFFTQLDLLHTDARSPRHTSLGWVTVAHSLGAQAVVAATIGSIEERLRFLGTQKPTPITVEGVGDLIVLINPAVESYEFERLHRLSQQNAYSSLQTPRLLAIAGESNATLHQTFTLGRFFESKLTARLSEEDSERQALGVYKPHVTHLLSPSDPSVRLTYTRISAGACEVDSQTWLRPPQQQLPPSLAPGQASIGTFDFSGAVAFGNVLLSPVTAANSAAGYGTPQPYQPFIIARASSSVVGNGSAATNDVLTSFLVPYILYVEQKNRLTIAR